MEPPWPLSVISGELVDGDIARALRFAHAGEPGPSAQVVSIEARAASAAAVMRLATLVPRAMTLAIEIPCRWAGRSGETVLAAVKAAGRIAKLRTGGVTPDAVPRPNWWRVRLGLRAPPGCPSRRRRAASSRPIRAAPHVRRRQPPRRRARFLNVLLAAVVAWTAAQGGPVGHPLRSSRSSSRSGTHRRSSSRAR